MSQVAVYHLAVPKMAPDLADALDPDEKSRLSRFSLARDQQLFIAAHALLRYALHQFTGTAAWRYEIDRFGKPSLAGRPDIGFNLSHTDGMAVCAVTRAGKIGIDVERLSPYDESDDIATALFAASEQGLLDALVGHARTEAFFRLWTLKEAVVKAIGEGLSVPLADFAFSWEPLTLTFAKRSLIRRRWHVEDRRLSDLHHAALAVRCNGESDLAIEWTPVTVETLADSLPLLRQA